jgi:hypothetical protein
MKRVAWEVWHGRTLVCSRQMGLTEAQARNKVENEERHGIRMRAMPAPTDRRDFSEAYTLVKEPQP